MKLTKKKTIGKLNPSSSYTQESQEEGNDSCFACCLLRAGMQAHVYHWQMTGTGSQGAHVALGDFYSGISDLADNYVETSMGLNPPPTGFAIEPIKDWTSSADPINFLMEFIEELNEHRESQTETDLQNQIDEMLSLTKKTLFKLKRLND